MTLASPLAAQVPDPPAARSPTGGDRCPLGRISYIFIDNHSVFDVDKLEEDQPFRWAFLAANALHMRTRADFLRKELLFGEGDCYDPFLMEESGRLLRRYSFLTRADVFALRQPDGNWHVVVDTQDEWTTELNARVSLEEGVEFRGADLTEENLLGRGILVGGFLNQKDERQDVGVRLATPRLAGTRLDGALAVGRTRVGSFFVQELAYPFLGEIGRIAGRQRYRRRSDRFTYWTRDREEVSPVLLPVRLDAFELTVAGRVGEPGDLTVFGLGLSGTRLRFPGYPGSVEISDDGDFDTTQPAPAEVAELLRQQTRFRSGTRLNLLFGQRKIRFVQRRGLDALRGLQDVPLGVDLALTLGRTVGDFPGSEEGADDLYTRLRLFAGGEPGPFLTTLDLGLQARQVFEGADSARGWRDFIAELDGLLYWQPDLWPNHTFFARVAGAGGWESDLPFQLTLGGPAGLRGFREERFPGARRLVVSFEDRIYLGWPLPRFADTGVTLFADVGRMWAGDVPFGVDTGWRASLGAGLRIGFPAGTRGVARMDLVFPVEGPGLGSPILRISLLDLLGLERALVERQLGRSRPNPVGPDLFTGAGAVR
jgi:hypothetical protein